MVGPLKCASGGFEYIYVAIDKFTKWIDISHLSSSTLQRQSSLCKTLCIGLACLIESLQILAHPLRLSNSEVGLKIAASALIMLLSLILKQMDK
jgi:hypothetical protein